MNVQLGRCCTFITVPGTRTVKRIRVITPFYDRRMKKNVQLGPRAGH